MSKNLGQDQESRKPKGVQRRVLKTAKRPRFGRCERFSRHFPMNQPYSHQNYNSFGQWSPRGDVHFKSESKFVKSAEASVEDAFASIDSIVATFSSVAHMLELTYTSVHSSFKAVLTVADHLSKLKEKLVKIMNSLMMFGVGQKIVRKFWSLFMYTESQDVLGGMKEMGRSEDKQDLWPFITFLVIACAGPYFIYKMIPDVTDENSEVSYEVTATVVHPYRAMNPDEVDVTIGDVVTVAPDHLQPSHLNGWTLVSCEGEIGIVPTSYLQFDDDESSEISSVHGT